MQSTLLYLILFDLQHQPFDNLFKFSFLFYLFFSQVLIEELLKNGAPELVTETAEGQPSKRVVSGDLEIRNGYEDLHRASLQKA